MPSAKAGLDGCGNSRTALGADGLTTFPAPVTAGDEGEVHSTNFTIGNALVDRHNTEVRYEGLLLGRCRGSADTNAGCRKSQKNSDFLAASGKEKGSKIV